jgi:predicted lipid-binding transport protein (Tim44 family)
MNEHSEIQRPDTDTQDPLKDKMESESIQSDDKQQKPSIDYFNLFFRGGLSGFMGFMSAGILVGFIEGTGSGISNYFGSLLSIGLSMAFMIAFWILFTYVGPFKEKESYL